MRLKYLAYPVFLFFPLLSSALPDFSKSIGFNRLIDLTILVDSDESDLFYYFPQRFGLRYTSNSGLFFQPDVSVVIDERDEDLVLEFNATISPYFDRESVQKSFNEIITGCSRARFSLPRIVVSEFRGSKLLADQLGSITCQSFNGLIGQDVVCEGRILGKKKIDQFLTRMSLPGSSLGTIHLKFDAKIRGAISQVEHDLAVTIGKIPPENILWQTAKGRKKIINNQPSFEDFMGSVLVGKTPKDRLGVSLMELQEYMDRYPRLQAHSDFEERILNSKCFKARTD